MLITFGPVRIGMLFSGLSLVFHVTRERHHRQRSEPNLFLCLCQMHLLRGSVPISLGPFQHVGIIYVLVFVDYFTEYMKLIALPNIKAETVAWAFIKDVVCHHGTHAYLHSDRGTYHIFIFTKHAKNTEKQNKTNMLRGKIFKRPKEARKGLSPNVGKKKRLHQIYQQKKATKENK